MGMPCSHDIRKATADDVSGLVPLVARYWDFEGLDGFDPARIGSLLERVVSDPHLGRVWIAEKDARPSAYLLLAFVFSLEHGGVMAEIDEFYVVPEERSSGLGAALLSAAENDLKAASLVRLQLQLGRENAKARSFYRRQGFAERDGYELLDKPLSAER